MPPWDRGKPGAKKEGMVVHSYLLEPSNGGTASCWTCECSGLCSGMTRLWLLLWTERAVLLVPTLSSRGSTLFIVRLTTKPRRLGEGWISNGFGCVRRGKQRPSLWLPLSVANVHPPPLRGAKQRIIGLVWIVWLIQTFAHLPYTKKNTWTSLQSSTSKSNALFIHFRKSRY